MERRTGRRTKPFSIPNTVRMANTAKKYLKEREKMIISWKFKLERDSFSGHTFFVR